MFSLITSESLAQELVEMFVSEQKLKVHDPSLYMVMLADNRKVFLFSLSVF
jgi:hypothetical protein